MPFSVRRYAGRTTQSTDCAPYATVKARHKTDSIFFENLKHKLVTNQYQTDALKNEFNKCWTYCSLIFSVSSSFLSELHPIQKELKIF